MSAKISSVKVLNLKSPQSRLDEIGELSKFQATDTEFSCTTPATAQEPQVEVRELEALYPAPQESPAEESGPQVSPQHLGKFLHLRKAFWA